MTKNRPLVLLWHGIDPDDVAAKYLDRYNPTASVFREQLKFIVSRYTPVSIFDFVSLIQGRSLKSSYSKPPVLLSFDDGFRSVIDKALPLLLEFDAPAVFFILCESLKNSCFVPWFVEVEHLLRRTTKTTVLYRAAEINLTTPGSYRTIVRLFEAAFRPCRSEEKRQACLNYLANELEVERPRATELDEDLRFVTKEDLIGLPNYLTIGSHGMTHHHFDCLTPKELLYELEESHSLLEHNCSSYYPTIAYPHGRFSIATIGIARRIYKFGFATSVNSSYGNWYAYPRIGIEQYNNQQLSYAISSRRIKYFLPLKRFLHGARIWRSG